MIRVLTTVLLMTTALLSASERVFVVGAGPTGLLSAIKLAETGAEVTVAEKRSPQYSRMQIVTLDRRWVATLQSLNSPLFQELISEGHARYNNDSTLDIAINQLECGLKQIAESLPNITLLYQTEVLKVKQPAEEGLPFRVKLSTDKVETFDLIVFAAGANDRLKDQFLDLAIPYTEAVNYTVSVWNKKLKDYRRLPKNHIDGMSIIDHQVFLSLQYLQLSETLWNLEGLDPQLMTECSQLLNTIQMQTAIPYREYDNAHHLYVGIELPQRRATLRELLSNAKEQATSDKELQSIVAMVKSLDQSTAEMIGTVWNLPEEAFEMQTRNTATFPLVQRAVIHPTKVVEMRGSQAVFAAVGDDLVSPHFFSGSGLTSGRESVENLVVAFKQWRSGKRPLETIIASLYQNQHEVIQYALDKGRPYVPFLEPEQSIEWRVAKRKEQIDNIESSKEIVLNEIGDYSYYTDNGTYKEFLNGWEISKLSN